jgi:hypothetical protein
VRMHVLVLCVFVRERVELDSSCECLCVCVHKRGGGPYIKVLFCLFVCVLYFFGEGFRASRMSTARGVTTGSM